MLLLGALGVTVKMLFCGFTGDDAYLIAMSYRRAVGDRLFMEMWEPHQTSAFLCAFFIRLFVMATGSVDYLVIFLRVIGLIIHALTAFFLYRSVRLVTDKEYAFLIAVLSYSMFPKLSAIPEYSNMNYWFLTVSLCFLLRAYLCRFEKVALTVASATFLSLLIVTYPTAILVSFVYLVAFLCTKEGRRLKAVGCFFVTCFAEAIIYTVIVFAGKNVKTVFSNIQKVFSGDESHLSGVNVAGQTAVENYVFGTLTLLLQCLAVLAVSVLIAFLVGKIRKKGSMLSITFGAAAVISFALSLSLAFVQQTGFDCLKVQYILLPALVCFGMIVSKEDKGLSSFYGAVLASGFVFLIGMCFISNLEIKTNIPHLQVSLIWSFIVAFCFLREKNFLKPVLILVTFISIGFTGYVQKTTAIGKNIFQYNAINNNGPAKRVICDWVIKANYESANEELKSVASRDDSLFIVSNDLYAPPTELYMITGAKIGQYSTQLTTPTYGATHMEYWEEFPDRLPTMVVVGKGMERFFDESVACRWLFEHFDFVPVLDGEYYTYYRRSE